MSCAVVSAEVDVSAEPGEGCLHEREEEKVKKPLTHTHALTGWGAVSGRSRNKLVLVSVSSVVNGSSELPEEAGVVLDQVTNIGDSVEDHREGVSARPKRPSP